MADPRVRQIKIKTGVVKRLVKEKMMYEKEAKQQEEKIEKMKAEDGENYAIKKQAEILQESRMMIPDCQRRLEAAHTDLLQLLCKYSHCDQFQVTNVISRNRIGKVQASYSMLWSSQT
uniref:Tubulin folding cofactor A n=1 Tax=Ovis aries TaxID=9940 RepID=A0AC11CLS9_SHEEP